MPRRYLPPYILSERLDAIISRSSAFTCPKLFWSRKLFAHEVDTILTTIRAHEFPSEY